MNPTVSSCLWVDVGGRDGWEESLWRCRLEEEIPEEWVEEIVEDEPAHLFSVDEAIDSGGLELSDP